MDYKSIINLMKEMNHTDLTRLEIEEEGIRICLEKAAPALPPAAVPLSSQVQTAAAASVTQVQTAAAAGSSLEAAPAEDKAEVEHHKKIVAPMVGTFYAQPAPDKPPFVKVGDKVKKGQTICIIEAMKLMNEIESEHDGEIVKILTENEQMVEYGQPLFLIK